MKKTDQMLLEALKASLKEEKVGWTETIPEEEWLVFFQRAAEHKILPLVYEAVYTCPAICSLDEEQQQRLKKQVIFTVASQTAKTRDFLEFYRKLTESGLEVLVLKGLICRELYPKPDHRISADEDLLVRKEDYQSFHEAALRCGLYTTTDPSREGKEAAYGKKGSPLYIEVHQTLLDEDSEAYGDWNRCFSDPWTQKEEHWINEQKVLTLNSTEHLCYLIFHALKHFLHSGFGIRQVCDIGMFAVNEAGKIDWDKVFECCREIHGEKFAAAIFAIAKNNLGLDAEAAGCPIAWSKMGVDESRLLDDLLEGGIYGNASRNRLHSSNLTLSAMTAKKQGKKVHSALRKSVFLPAESLKEQYGYLKKSPYLLPVAWGQRIWNYWRETRKSKESRALETIRIGNQRIELLRYYGILK